MCDPGVHVQILKLVDGSELHIVEAHPNTLMSEIIDIVRNSTGVAGKALWLDIAGNRVRAKPDWKIKRFKLDEIVMYLEVEGCAPDDDQPLAALACSSIVVDKAKGKGKGKGKSNRSIPY